MKNAKMLQGEEKKDKMTKLEPKTAENCQINPR